MKQSVIRFEEVSLGYGEKPILNGLNFAVARGDFLGIVGPNGAGKTTILKGILGIIKPSQGRIIFKEGNSSGLQVGYVPQRESLDEIFPFTVSEIVMMGRYRSVVPGQRPGPKDRASVEKVLHELGISELAGRLYRDISGGQKQRALIARALVGNPEVLILDEPTNGMDLSSQKAILDLIRYLHEGKELTVVLVSHLLNEVATYAEQLALVDQGFFQIGPSEEILREENLSQLYSIQVKVGTCGQYRIVVPGGSKPGVS